ncbi:MAG: fibronectin type III domain-containing protein [Deltaproteobacteria bacterium]|nr:fibronectin type III domain-containing protein [Deltaproteobacteria bacterium]
MVLTCAAISTTQGIDLSLQAGDIVSADYLNERINRIEPDLTEVLVGSTWTTECWDEETADDVDNPGTGILTIHSLTDIDYENVSDANDVCIFGIENEGMTPTRVFERFKVVGNRGLIAITDNPNSEAPEGDPMRISSYSWIVVELSQNSLLLSNGAYRLLRVTRLNTVPAEPSSATTAVSGRTVTIIWTDNSSDETGFSILRKDSLTGTYTQVGTVGANTTTYSESVSAGTYWYRVQATNANGASLGSNVRKETIE